MPDEILRCPNCGLVLSKDGKSFRCTHKHTFDEAKEGYLNLLLANEKKAKQPGDNKEMILNRELFLSLGYYDKLVDSIHNLIPNKTDGKLDQKVLDIGCGSGYFIRTLDQKSLEKIGLDISKFAISKAAKLDKKSKFIVGSFKRIPLVNESIDVVLNNFAPLSLHEVYRVLKPLGTIIKIIPYKNHMKQLAELIYNEFHPHTSDFIKQVENFKGLELKSKTEISYEYKLSHKEALHLISMTPYFHKFKLLDISLPPFILVSFSFQIIEIKKV